MDMGNFFDRTNHKGWKYGKPFVGVGHCSALTSCRLCSPYIMDINMNYNKVASGSLALISAPLYLAYDDEPRRNSSAGLE